MSNLATQPESMSSEQDLVVHGSAIPVIRAGWANLLPFLWLVWMVGLYVIASHVGAETATISVLAAGLTVIFLRVYSSAVSRIALDGKSLRVTGAIRETMMPIERIEYLKTSVYPAWMAFKLKIKMRDNRRPRSFHFVAVATNYGSLVDTEARLRARLERHGIAVR